MFIVKHKICMLIRISERLTMYGKKLKAIRKYLNLTQENMAKELNLACRTYTAYEREENQPPYTMLVDLCKNKNINLNWFIADVGNMLNANAQQFEQEQNVFAQKVRELISEEFKLRGL